MRGRIRGVVLLTFLAVVLVATWTAVALHQAVGELHEARRALEQAQQQASDQEAAATQLARAERRLRRAAGWLHQPGPRVAAAVPLAGRSVDAARVTAVAGAVVVGEARAVLASVPDRLLTDGRVDLDRLLQVEDALRAAADRTREPVGHLLDLELAATPGVVGAGVREAQGRLGDVPGTLSRTADAIAGLRGVLGHEGERRLLVVLQNNAELRATGGLVSVFARATARDGALQVDGFQDVEDVADAAAVARPVPAPADYRALFGPYKAGTTLWRNVNMAPDVPMTSTVLAEVARASLGEAPDAVLWLDVPAIAAVLRATGPVELPEGPPLSADDAVRRLLSEAYADADDSFTGQERRRAALRAAADAVLARLLAPGADVDAVALARQLTAAGAGRHVAVWSARPEEQRRLAAGRLAGAVTADSGDVVAPAVHNLGDGDGLGNKLDFYSRRLVTVRVEVGRTSALVEQELAVRNTAPTDGLPFYVAGLRRPGVLNQLVSLAVPTGADVERFLRDDQPLPIEPRALGDHSVLLDAARVPPGGTLTWRLRYRVPVQDGRYRLQLFPQPLAVDAGLSVSVTAAPGLELLDGAVSSDGPFDSTRTVEAVAQRPSWLSRTRAAIRTFWNEPVRLP